MPAPDWTSPGSYSCIRGARIAKLRERLEAAQFDAMRHSRRAVREWCTEQAPRFREMIAALGGRPTKKKKRTTVMGSKKGEVRARRYQGARRNQPKNDNETTPELPTREGLRQAHEIRNTALKRRDTLSAAIESGLTFISQIQSQIDEIEAQDEKLANARAASIKSACVSGGVVPDFATPKEMRERREQKAELEAKLNAARKSLSALRADFDLAAAELAKADSAVDKAAVAVLSEKAAALAVELEAVENVAAIKRGILTAFSSLRHNARFLPASPLHHQLLHNPPANARIGVLGDSKVIAQWADALRSLKADPDAEINVTAQAPPPPTSTGVIFGPDSLAIAKAAQERASKPCPNGPEAEELTRAANS